jgi:hypothetical protein
VKIRIVSMKPIEEAELTGKWLFENGKVVGDEIEQRIWELVKNRFTRLADREGGWVILHQDPVDGSFWELSFPQGELHGGGPRRLTRLTENQVQDLYPGVTAGNLFKGKGGGHFRRQICKGHRGGRPAIIQTR